MKQFKEILPVFFLFITGNILLVPVGMFLVSKWEGVIQSDCYYDFLFGMLWLLITVYYIYKIGFALTKGYLSSFFYFVISVLTGVTYGIQRFIADYFLFLGFSILPAIKYLDFIFLGVLLNSILFCCNKPQINWLKNKFPWLVKLTPKNEQPTTKEPDKEEDTLKPSFFYTDDPEEGLVNDKLSGRQKAAEELALRITETSSKRAFAIAIEGEWGSGKTVFLKQIQKVLKNKSNANQIIIEFNPWDGTMPNSIIENFFGVLSAALSEYSTQLAWQINSYMDNLISSNDNTLINGILHFFKSFFGSSALSTKFDHINDTLKKLNKQLIIFIDDLDRLDKPEIWEVVKLIRNTANFYNTIFVLAFDRGYVVEALNEFSKHKTKRFLEKIFQLEIQIPAYSHISLKDFFRDKIMLELNRYLNSEKERGNESEISLARKIDLYDQSIDALISSEYNIKHGISFTDNLSNLPENLFDKYISTYRDVYRFVNSFKLKIPSVEGEVCLTDFLMIELIRLKYPDIANELYWHGNSYLYPLHEVSVNPGFLKIIPDTNEVSTLDNMLSRVGYDLNSTDSSVIKSTLHILFGDGFANSDKVKTIRRPSNFHKYFSYGLFDGDFPHKDFDYYRQNKTEEMFLKQLMNWEEKGLTNDIFTKFIGIELGFDGKNDLEKIVRVFFRFCDGIQNGSSVSEYYFNNLLKNTFELQQKYYKDKDEFASFVINLYCNHSTFPFLFAQNTLSNIEFITDSTKFELYAKYFKEYLTQYNGFNLEIRNLYFLLKKLNKEKQSEIKLLLLDFIKKKALKSFFEHTSYYHPFSSLSSVSIQKDGFIVEFFGNEQTFEEFIEGLPKEPYIEEYRNYYKQCKANSFEPIKFEFNELKSPFPYK